MNGREPVTQPDIEFELVEYGAWLFAMDEAGEAERMVDVGRAGAAPEPVV